MSIRLMSVVWEHSPEKNEGLLVLLALADFADDTGWCFPSLETLAAKARCTVRGAQGILTRLKVTGQIEVSYGTGRGHVNRYHILVKGEPETPFVEERVQLAAERVNVGVERVQLAGSYVHPEPSGTINSDPSSDPSYVILAPFRELRGFDASKPRELATLVDKLLVKYATVDLEEEALKMAAWLGGPKGKGRKCSPGFILNWLGKDGGGNAANQRNGHTPQVPGKQPGSGEQRQHPPDWGVIINVDEPD